MRGREGMWFRGNRQGRCARHERELERRQTICRLARGRDAQGIPASERSRMGICCAWRNTNQSTGGATSFNPALPIVRIAPTSRPPSSRSRSAAFKPNPFGLYDMGGGVDQWVEDCWHKNYQGAPADGSPWVEGECPSHVIRSGSWKNDARYVRPSNRDNYDTNVRYPTHGFRVALSPLRVFRGACHEDRPAHCAIRGAGICCRALPTPKESLRQKMRFSISFGRRTVRRSKADFGVVSVCETWASPMRATIFRTAVIIIC